LQPCDHEQRLPRAFRPNSAPAEPGRLTPSITGAFWLTGPPPRWSVGPTHGLGQETGDKAFALSPV